MVSITGTGAPWRVGIEDPDNGSVAGVVTLVRGAVATSGVRARGAHIVDPYTGTRPTGLRQVTVIGPSLIWADVLATAAFVQGPAALRWLRDHVGYQGVVFDHTCRMTRSAGLILD